MSILNVFISDLTLSLWSLAILLWQEPALELVLPPTDWSLQAPPAAETMPRLQSSVEHSLDLTVINNQTLWLKLLLWQPIMGTVSLLIVEYIFLHLSLKKGVKLTTFVRKGQFWKYFLFWDADEFVKMLNKICFEIILFVLNLVYVETGRASTTGATVTISNSGIAGTLPARSWKVSILRSRSVLGVSGI